MIPLFYYIRSTEEKVEKYLTHTLSVWQKLQPEVNLSPHF